MKSEFDKKKSAKVKMAPAQVYSLNLEGGKKYVGMTKPGPIVNGITPLQRRLTQNGAKWTQKYHTISVNSVQKCKSETTAKKAETIVYKNMRDYHGGYKVREQAIPSLLNFFFFVKFYFNK